jgi:hypothetical protein
MPDQLFTYYIESPLVIISINNWSWGIIAVWPEIETCIIDKGDARREGGKGVWEREEIWGLLGFVALLCLSVFPLL